MLAILSIASILFVDIYFKFFLVFKFFIKTLFIFREGKGGREGEKHQCVVPSHAPPTGDLAYNPGMCSRLGIELATLWFAGQLSIH